MFRNLRQLALLGLAALPGSLAGPLDVTCVDKAADQNTYTAASGAVFQIFCGIDYAGSDMAACGIDYAGGDVAATSTATFEGCIDACAATSGCIDVSYVGEACYMKKKLEVALEREWVWTAKLVESGSGSPESSTKLSCDDYASSGQIYEATNSDFEIACFKDYAECIDACDAHHECLNLAYVHGACYLKKQQSPAVDNASVWGAVRKSATSTTSTTTTTTSTPSSTTTPLTCEGNASNMVEHKSAKNGVYQILCGVDFGGNDLTATATATFEDCIAACDENAECVDVSYVAPACYLKNAVGDMTQPSHVWTAKQLQPSGSVPKGTITCPKSDGQTYRDDKGNRWAIRCNYDYQHYDTQQVWADTMDECLAWCGTQPNCAGVSYGTEHASGHWNCWARTRAGPVRASSHHSMMLLSPFEIINAVYGTANITGPGRAAWRSKPIFILYRYGGETRTWVGLQNTGVHTIYPGDIMSMAPPMSAGLSRQLTVPDIPASRLGLPNWIRPIDICYGRSPIRNMRARDAVYRAAYAGQVSRFQNELLGDTWPGAHESGVIWYRDTREGEGGKLYVATAVEHHIAGDTFTLMDPSGKFNAAATAGRDPSKWQ
ncbi:hypothetical protein N658DRAFT_528043 [Parathielavia hyrcaniae]|uniref:Apple domain-containing protein n=1 Tax=Parathielavia hyrcaniae TaxID=113614 RepID=A0AAN6PUT6_9PEZI|nr:hypothetical protein N658DRAFT_528043 [Parathielavia hyrcaniae]